MSDLKRREFITLVGGGRQHGRSRPIDEITALSRQKERRAGPKLASGCVEPRTSYKTSLPGPSPKAVMAG
jgi:hypothetical protein